ncbi:MAG: General stress protein 16U [Candidatus Erwinia impunctatus]|nr:General stress protein 16U [Culicoides impunctatus]
MNLTPGGNAPVPATALQVKIMSVGEIDASAFCLFAGDKVRGDADMIFYGQPENADKSISLSFDTQNATFTVALDRLSNDVQKVAFTITCDNNRTVGMLSRLSISVTQGATSLIEADVPLAGRNEAALIVGEFYRRNGEWKFRFVAQGFNGGLKPLAEHFGVDIADSSASHPPVVTPPAAPAENKISLSKVSLTKEKPAISLTKQDDFGQIRINLNWHRGEGKAGLFGLFGAKGIDLDLGAFVALANGEKTVIQALGNSFGNYQNRPYVELQGDDRTGSVSDGEWLHVNGKEWKQLREVLIYAFIYGGYPAGIKLMVL